MAKETYNLYAFRPLHSNARTKYYPVAATQTIRKGDPVILNAGAVQIAVAASSTQLLGVAAQDAVLLATGTQIAVYDDPNTIFRARVSADASAVQIGYEPDLAGTTGAFTVNVGASAQDVFIYRGCLPQEDCREVGAYCEVLIRNHVNATVRA